MMTCREVYGFLDDFLEGALDMVTRLSFEGHLLLCPACRNYLATYRASIETAQNSERADAPAGEVPEELVALILASRSAAAREPRAGS